jgi:hypothetical protein
LVNLKQRYEGGDDVREPRVLLIDIETSPNLGYVWAKWQQDVIDYEKEWFILCYSYRWMNDGKVRNVSLPNFRGYQKDKENDLKLMLELRKTLNQADVVIAHNGDNFDLPKIYTRFLYHRITPPAPFRTVDTCKIARSRFGFNSNKLDDIARYLGIGRKKTHIGFPLWKGCAFTGDPKAWKVMVGYNNHDVHLLEQVYLRFRPWINNHPNFNVFTETDACPKCQGTELQKRGFSITTTGKKQRLLCLNQECGAWSHGKIQKVTNIR